VALKITNFVIFVTAETAVSDARQAMALKIQILGILEGQKLPSLTPVKQWLLRFKFWDVFYI